MAEEKQYNIDEQTNRAEEQSPYEVPDIDFFATTLAEYDEFDERARNKGTGYIAPNYPFFTNALEGLDEGLFIFAAESNMGKSALTLNLMMDFVLHPDNKLVGVFFTLDDSKQEIIPRILAAHAQIPISVCAKPQRYQEEVDACGENSVLYEDLLEKREEALEWIKTTNENFKIVDTDIIRCGEQIFDYCKKMQEYVRRIDPEMNLLVCIDSLADVKFPSQNFRAGDEYAEMSFVSQIIKELAMQDLKCPVFTTYHLKKIEQNKRPTIADLRGAGRLVYEASVIFLLHNDVSRNGDCAAICVNDTDTGATIPVIEIQWAKNKKSDFKGRSYCKFYPRFSKTYECTDDERKRFDALIYSSK